MSCLLCSARRAGGGALSSSTATAECVPRLYRSAVEHPQLPSVIALGLDLTQAAWPAFLLLGFQAVSKALLSVELWGIAGQVFNVRQGKRLFGLIGSGELLATVVGDLPRR